MQIILTFLKPVSVVISTYDQDLCMQYAFKAFDLGPKESKGTLELQQPYLLKKRKKLRQTSSHVEGYLFIIIYYLHEIYKSRFKKNTLYYKF